MVLIQIINGIESYEIFKKLALDLYLEPLLSDIIFKELEGILPS